MNSEESAADKTNASLQFQLQVASQQILVPVNKGRNDAGTIKPKLSSIYISLKLLVFLNKRHDMN